MRCTIPEISWHNRDPVLSVDIQPKTSNDNVMRLASGGTDCHVLIWYVKQDTDQIKLVLATDLARHQRGVNVVRWSPSGETLASGDDEGEIILWQKRDEGASSGGNLFDDECQNLETWIIHRTLRGHLRDVYDLAWAPSSEELLSGSVDNTAIVWKTNNRTNSSNRIILDDHKGFVQGVAWDPKNKYLATLATDRYFRLFHARTHKLCRRMSKAKYPVTQDSPHYDKTFRLFHDDTLQTFYRRICFSPDGELIFVPSGVTEELSNENESARKCNTTYIFTRYNTKSPAVILPAIDQYTVAVRCCPLLFNLRPHDDKIRPMINLPYRVIFAVATKKSVYFYDTQQKMPFGIISNIHYARLTDLAWSSDGTTVVVSSVDGFCTVVTFDEGELGDIYIPPTDMDMDIDEEENSKDSDDKDDVENDVPTDIGNVLKPTQNNVHEVEHMNIVADNATVDMQPKPIAVKRLPKSNDKDAVIEIKIPETIIATTDQFESPEYKSKPATPIAVRRVPRTGSTPSSSSASSNAKATAQNPTTPVGKTAASGRKTSQTKRSPRLLEKSAPPEQEEALDSWPQPIDGAAVETGPIIDNKDCQTTKDCVELADDVRLIYEGESELTNIKPSLDAVNTTVEAKSTVPVDLDTVTPESKSAKTPRRVELRTLTTPKAKKKIF